MFTDWPEEAGAFVAAGLLAAGAADEDDAAGAAACEDDCCGACANVAVDDKNVLFISLG